MDNTEKFSIKRIFQWVLLVFLAALLVFTLWKLGKDFCKLHQFRPERSIRFGRRWFPAQNIAAQPSPSAIKNWMTFRYINLLFNLPQDYLKSSLKITNTRYPNLTVDNLGKEQKRTSAEALSAVASAVQKYISDRGPAPQ